MPEINIQGYFEDQLQDYESLITKLIPYYKEQHQIIQSLLPTNTQKEYKILDLGCGDGTLSELVLQKLPNSYVVGFDMTKDLLNSYEEKISKLTSKYEVINGDYRTDYIGDDYDIVISSMTLHHVSLDDRKRFYSKLFDAVNDEAIYISSDMIVDEDTSVREYQYDLWKQYIKSSGEDSEFWYEKHLENDYPITIQQQKEWLSSVGFSNAACYWRYSNFAITKTKAFKSNEKITDDDIEELMNFLSIS